MEVEYLAALYCRTLAVGSAIGADPRVISQRKMGEILEIVRTYGKQPDPDPSEG